MSQARVLAHAFGEYRESPGLVRGFAVARSVLLVGRVEGEENIRAVVQIKNNLAAFGHPKAFVLSEGGFQWLGDYEITADEVLGGIVPKANKMEQAKRLLQELAETNNAIQSNEIFNLAKAGSGGIKAAKSRPPSAGRYAVQRTACPRQGAKTLLIKRSVSKVLLRYFRRK